jgi:transaldolase
MASPDQEQEAIMNLLDQLREMTTVVADTGDIGAIRTHQPTDATTNPSLLYKASQQSEFSGLVDEAIAFGEQQASGEAERLEATIDKLFVNFGSEILGIIDGRVSTEVDARLSFDVEGSVAKAHRLIELYEQAEIGRERVLIKLASTWEGMLAARQLEKEGIHCNMTLMFALPQAAAAAEVGATLISPFVGRIYDWHKADRGVDDIPIEEDPGVASVHAIYAYLKKFNAPVEIMGASFRKADQIVELAGCDLLTIAPELLEELRGREGTLTRKLDLATAEKAEIEPLEIDEPMFRWLMNEDAMATEKLAEGIRRFHADMEKLRDLLRTWVSKAASAT